MGRVEDVLRCLAISLLFILHPFTHSPIRMKKKSGHHNGPKPWLVVLALLNENMALMDHTRERLPSEFGFPSGIIR